MVNETYGVDDLFDLDGGDKEFRGIYKTGSDHPIDWSDYYLFRRNGKKVCVRDGNTREEGGVWRDLTVN